MVRATMRYSGHSCEPSKVRRWRRVPSADLLALPSRWKEPGNRSSDILATFDHVGLGDEDEGWWVTARDLWTTARFVHRVLGPDQGSARAVARAARDVQPARPAGRSYGRGARLGRARRSGGLTAALRPAHYIAAGGALVADPDGEILERWPLAAERLRHVIELLDEPGVPSLLYRESSRCAAGTLR